MIDYNVEGMNKHILNANIKLLDENKLLKEDKEMLQTRINRAIKYIKENKDAVEWVHCKSDLLIDILEGRFIDGLIE